VDRQTDTTLHYNTQFESYEFSRERAIEAACNYSGSFFVYYCAMICDKSDRSLTVKDPLRIASNQSRTRHSGLFSGLFFFLF
jgi:hypothetical protein